MQRMLSGAENIVPPTGLRVCAALSNCALILFALLPYLTSSASVEQAPFPATAPTLPFAPYLPVVLLLCAFPFWHFSRVRITAAAGTRLAEG